MKSVTIRSELGHPATWENNTAASNFKSNISMCMQLKCRFANMEIVDYICKEHIP